MTEFFAKWDLVSQAGTAIIFVALILFTRWNNVPFWKTLWNIYNAATSWDPIINNKVDSVDESHKATSKDKAKRK